MCNYIFSSSSCFSKQDTPSACGGVIHLKDAKGNIYATVEKTIYIRKK